MVEKRRIYDIVNVMEALEAMSKTNKSYYRWHGLSELPQLMAYLQQHARDENLLSRIRQVEQAMCSFTELASGNKRPNGDIVGTLVSSKTTVSVESPDQNLTSFIKRSDPSGCNGLATAARSSTVRDRNNKNSLAQLCRRFLMVLLCNPKDMRRVSLDVASTVLIKDPESEGFEPPSRSRCRRLYDIANVLVAMGIIKKVHYLFGTKKIPLFVYSGPEPDEELSYTFEKHGILESKENFTKGAKTSKICEKQLEIPEKRPNYVDLRRSYCIPQENKNFLSEKSDLDLLAVASEQRRQEFVEAEKNGANLSKQEDSDENVAPLISTRPVKMIRTSSGAVILKPEPKKEPKVLINGSEQEKKSILTSTSNRFQLFDPRQPHAFQKIEQFQSDFNLGNLSPSPLTCLNLCQAGYQSFGVPSSYHTMNSFASAYSVNALLAGPVTSPSNRIPSPYSVLQPKRAENIPRQRSVLGDISQSFRPNK